jgi:hypothetical protein
MSYKKFCIYSHWQHGCQNVIVLTLSSPVMPRGITGLERVKPVNIFIALLLWHVHSSINLAFHRVCCFPMSYKQCYIQRAVHIMLKCNAVAMIHREHKLSEAPDFHNIKEYSHMQSHEVSFTKCKLMFNFQPQSNVRMDCK